VGVCLPTKGRQKKEGETKKKRERSRQCRSKLAGMRKGGKKEAEDFPLVVRYCFPRSGNSLAGGGGGGGGQHGFVLTASPLPPPPNHKLPGGASPRKK
jgi:hypothetical protein